MIGHTSAKRQAPSLQKGHIFISHGLPELIQKPGFSHPGLRDDGKGLAPACLGPLQTIQQKLELSLPPNKGCKASLCTDVKPCPPGAGGNGPVDIDRLFPALNPLFPQGLKPKESLGQPEGLLRHIGCPRLCQLLHP